MYANYSAYVGNGPELALNAAGDEIDAVDTEGFGADADGNKVFGGRLGFLPIPNLELGVSGAFGDVALANEGDRDYDVLGFDIAWRWRNLNARSEWVRQRVGSLAGSVAPARQEWEAWYAQAAYKFLPTKFEAVVRYGDFASGHRDQAQEQWGLGINYLFSSQAIVKLGYEFNDGADGEVVDADRLLLQITYGF
jgi:hypothetical protein